MKGLVQGGEERRDISPLKGLYSRLELIPGYYLYMARTTPQAFHMPQIGSIEELQSI